MNICLFAATELEIPFLVEKLQNFSGNLAPGNYSLEWNESLNITLVITGIGMTQTTYYTAKTLLSKNWDLCIQVGICGAFNRNLNLGDVVNIKSEKFAQAGAENDTIFLDVFELGLQEENAFPFIDGWLINNSETPVSLNHLSKAKAITVETVHGNEKSIQKIQAKYHPDVESMEGAAFFYCCLQHNIPFVEIRAVSNFVEKRNKTNWNIPLAVESLQHVIVKLLNDLSK